MHTTTAAATSSSEQPQQHTRPRPTRAGRTTELDLRAGSVRLRTYVDAWVGACVCVSSPALGSSSRSVRTKDKLKHSRNETRRRARIRDQFEALKNAISCDKKDRYNILQAAVEEVQHYQVRIAQLEQLVAKYEATTKTRFRVSPLPPAILASLPSTSAANAAASKRKREEARKKRRRAGDDDDDEEDDDAEEENASGSEVDDMEEEATPKRVRAVVQPKADEEGEISEPESDEELRMQRDAAARTQSVGSLLSSDAAARSTHVAVSSNTGSAVNVLATLAHVASAPASSSTTVGYARPSSRKTSGADLAAAPTAAELDSVPGSNASSTSSKRRRLEQMGLVDDKNAAASKIVKAEVLMPTLSPPLSMRGLMPLGSQLQMGLPGSMSYPVMSSSMLQPNTAQLGMSSFGTFSSFGGNGMVGAIAQQQQPQPQGMMRMIAAPGSMAPMSFQYYPQYGMMAPMGMQQQMTMVPVINGAEFAQAAQQQQQQMQQQPQQQRQGQSPPLQSQPAQSSMMNGAMNSAFFYPSAVQAAS